MDTLTVPTRLRHAELPDLVEMLRQQADVRYDVVATADKLRYHDGILEVTDGALYIDEDGATSVPASLNPTTTFESGIAEKLGVPAVYLRRMREAGKADLLDHNVNEWLHDDPARKFFVRGFRTDDHQQVGVARAFLSDSYRPIDNLDVLMASLDGLRQAGITAIPYDANISETRMTVKVVAPEVQVLAEALLSRYRSPFDEDGRRPGAFGNALGAAGHEFRPYTVFAGFVLSNSETGGGAFSVAPQVLVRICGNGLTVGADAVRGIHTGEKLQEGRFTWSNETHLLNRDLVTSKTKDAVRTFLSEEYLTEQVRKIEAKAGKPVEDAVGTVERVSRAVGFTQEEQKSILDFFIKSGDLTAGGVMQAVTATAQVVDSPDRQAEMEDAALDVLAAV